MDRKMDLITGGTGFVGNYLVRVLLKKRKKMRVLCVKNSDITFLKKNNIDIAFGDLNDKTSLEKATKNINTVYHLAALIGGDEIPYKEFEKINVIGTKNLLEACIKNKVKRFIYFSSVASMGDVLNGNEKTICKPDTNYGKSKYEAEKIVNSYSKKINLTIIRPTFAYGPNQAQARSLSQLIQKILAKQFVIVGKGNNLINLIFIDDIIKAVLLIKENKKSIGQTYIISGERPYTINEFVKIIAEEGKVKMPQHIPISLAYLLGFSFTILGKILKFKPPLTLSRVENLIKSRSFDISKAKKELGYKPKINLKEGMRRTVEWYKEKNIL